MTRKTNLEKLFLKETKTSLNALKAAKKEYQKVLKQFVIKNISGKKDFKDFLTESYWMIREDAIFNPHEFIPEEEILENAINFHISLIEYGDFEDISSL